VLHDLIEVSRYPHHLVIAALERSEAFGRQIASLINMAPRSAATCENAI